MTTTRDSAATAQGGAGVSSEPAGDLSGSNPAKPCTLQAVHQREELRDYSSLDFTLRFIATRRDCVDLVDEDYRWLVRLRLFERIAKVVLRLARLRADSSQPGRVFGAAQRVGVGRCELTIFDMTSGPLMRKKKAPCERAGERIRMELCWWDGRAAAAAPSRPPQL